jgi:hypothetical protein
MRVSGDGNELKDVWVYLSPDEAREILLALQFWADEEEGCEPGWHMHVTDIDRELTLAIDPGEDGATFAKPSY